MSLLIQPDELATMIRRGDKITVLAAFWAPGEKAGYYAFEKAHIPTSIFCDPMKRLASAPSARGGRNPLPTDAILERAFTILGLTDTRTVVVYDLGKGLMAARAWWILTWAGVKNVRIVDGGLAKWVACGHNTVSGPGNLPRTATISPHPGCLPVTTIDEVKANTGRLLVDTREASRFAGRKERLDVRAGHIAGSINMPLSTVLNQDHTFKSKEEIRAAFKSYGIVDPGNAIIMSGSGLHSAVMIAAMHHAGIEGASLFVGGWSQWSADPANPVAHGDK